MGLVLPHVLSAGLGNSLETVPFRLLHVCWVCCSAGDEPYRPREKQNDGAHQSGCAQIANSDIRFCGPRFTLRRSEEHLLCVMQLRALPAKC
eukprot:6301949-Amphidinium_carterae.1